MLVPLLVLVLNVMVDAVVVVLVGSRSDDRCPGAASVEEAWINQGKWSCKAWDRA